MQQIAEKSEIPQENLTSKGTKEVKLPSGETLILPTLEVEKMRLYHGTGKNNIKQFMDSLATTVGAGIYMTSSFDSAAGYSILRTESELRENFKVYEGEIENMKLLDLTSPESWSLLGKIMAPEIEKVKNRTDFPLDWPQYYKDAVHRAVARALDRIKTGQIRGPSDIIGQHFGEIARRLFSKLGFDGINAVEGGEGWDDSNTIGNHNTFVIFDPKKVKIIKEVQIASHLPKIPLSPKPAG